MTVEFEEKFRKYLADATTEAVPWVPPVGAGWHSMIVAALEQIDALVGGDASKFQVDQIKEKFGTLRFHCRVEDDALRDAILKIIDDIETRSASMCERCGAPAQVHQYAGWLGCLCPEHAMQEIELRGMKLGARGWKLARIEGRPALIDKSAHGELGDERFAEIEARVVATMRAIAEEEGAGLRLGQRSSVGSSAASEVAQWRHAKFVAGR
jgi:hypothetical protein